MYIATHAHTHIYINYKIKCSIPRRHWKPYFFSSGPKRNSETVSSVDLVPVMSIGSIAFPSQGADMSIKSWLGIFSSETISSLTFVGLRDSRKVFCCFTKLLCQHKMCLWLAGLIHRVLDNFWLASMSVWCNIAFEKMWNDVKCIYKSLDIYIDVLLFLLPSKPWASHRGWSNRASHVSTMSPPATGFWFCIRLKT